MTETDGRKHDAGQRAKIRTGRSGQKFCQSTAKELGDVAVRRMGGDTRNTAVVGTAGMW